MLIDGSGCDPEELIVDPASFRSLYALHRGELEAVYDYIGDDRKKLALLTNIEFRASYDWRSAERACNEMASWNSVIFVFAHSDGDHLELDGSRIASNQFRDMLHRCHRPERTMLLILNCCLSVAGEENCSLLKAVAERGFCGLIGTEAEILNTHAIRCGTRLMWGMCAEGLTLGTAFDRMQSDAELFPLNLLYTCYAERDFRLQKPLEMLHDG